MATRSPGQSTTAQRYARYRSVLDQATACAEFQLSQLHSACAPERPAFVTRLVNDLAAQGWIVREDGDDAQVYRWNRGRGEFQLSNWLDNRVYGQQVTQAPEQERPRERLLSAGAAQLRTEELLAILIRSGRQGESAVQAGHKLARAFADRLQDLPVLGQGEAREISQVLHKTAYCQIMAGIELGRRVAEAGLTAVATKIRSSDDAIRFCQRRFARLAMEGCQEEFHIVTLNTKNMVLDTHQVTIGTLDASLVHAREVFRPAIKDAAAAVILVHNHPSGDPTPSREDYQVTKQLTQAGDIIGIEVLDHIVLGQTTACSLSDML